MASYWALWRRGWWVWLMMFICSAVHLTASLIAALAGGQAGGIVLGLLVWVFASIPMSGWVFEIFASKLKRLDLDPAEHAEGQ